MGSRCLKFHNNFNNFAKTLNHTRGSHVVNNKLLPTYGFRNFSISSFNYIERRPESPRLIESYYHATSESRLRGITVGNLLQETVEKFPDRECLVFCDGNHRRTFAQFMEDVDNLAAGLLQLGLEKGDRVGIWGPNTLEWVTTQFATARMGAVLVNVNPAYQTHEMEYALRLVGCKALVASASYKTQNYYEMLREVAPDIERTQPGHLSCKTLPDLKTIIMISDDHFHGTYKFYDVMSAGGPREVAKVHNLQKQFQFDDDINIQFTSGTTGHPKGATLSHHNIVNNAQLIGNRLGYDDGEDRICCQVPLYHCFGMVAGVMCMATHGATNIFPITGYDPEATVKCLQKENCTAIYGTPTMFIDVCAKLDAMDLTFPTLKKGIMAGSPCPPEVINRTDQLLGTTIQNQISSIEPGVFRPLSKATVQILTLKMNKLTGIRDGYFDGLQKLKNLILDDNLIQSISANALNVLKNIRKLSLENNQLASFPNEVKLPLLSTLTLANNKLTSLADEVFSDMGRLGHINLSSNALSSISESTFEYLPKLHTLDLSSNRLVSLHDLPNGREFTNLFLGANLWQCDCAIQDMRRWIETTDYDVTCTSPAEHGGKSLKSLTIEDLRCAASEPATRPVLPVTTSLPLPANPVLTGSSRFYCPEKCVCAMDVRHINCNRRGYTAVPSRLPDTAALVDLRDNKIRLLEANSFMCPHVISLHLQRNGLQRIRTGAFRHLAKLVYLYLNRNQITEIEAGAFEGLETLAYLFLDHNRIAAIPSGLFRPLASIYSIYLRRNYLVALRSDSMEGLERLRWFYVSWNRLTHIDDDAFKSCPSLNRLYLGNNELSAFPVQALTGLTLLNHLDLSGNFIDVIPASWYKWMTQIQSLDLASNQIFAIEGGFLDKLIDLKSLNVSDNLLRHLPELPTSLTELKLANNTMTCDCKIAPLWKWVTAHQPKSVTCSAPANRAGRDLSTFLLSDFDCNSPGQINDNVPLGKINKNSRKKQNHSKAKKKKQKKARAH